MADLVEEDFVVADQSGRPSRGQNGVLFDSFLTPTGSPMTVSAPTRSSPTTSAVSLVEEISWKASNLVTSPHRPR